MLVEQMDKARAESRCVHALRMLYCHSHRHRDTAPVFPTGHCTIYECPAFPGIQKQTGHPLTRRTLYEGDEERRRKLSTEQRHVIPVEVNEEFAGSIVLSRCRDCASFKEVAPQIAGRQAIL